MDNEQWCLVVVADLKSIKKEDYGIADNSRYVFLSVNDQMALYPEFSALVPFNHFGRKNVGYLYAINSGAKRIWDFDDGNMGVIDVEAVLANQPVTLCSEDQSRLINPYMYFGVDETTSWPRGFPLDRIRDEKTSNLVTCPVNISLVEIGVIQSLANNEPDVDGVYRLTRKTPFNFTLTPPPLILPSNTFTPFNAQATMWYSAFKFMYLPTTVHGRVSDIWRSYITEYFLGVTGGHVIFTKPYVVQDRNAHNFLSDFQSESDLYLKASSLVHFLQNRPSDKLSANDPQVFVEALRLYIDLYERDILEEDDVLIFTYWLKHLGLSEDVDISISTSL